MCLILKILAMAIVVIAMLFFVGVAVLLFYALSVIIKSEKETSLTNTSSSLEYQNDEYDYGHNVPHPTGDYMGYWDF